MKFVLLSGLLLAAAGAAPASAYDLVPTEQSPTLISDSYDNTPLVSDLWQGVEPEELQIDTRLANADSELSFDYAQDDAEETAEPVEPVEPEPKWDYKLTIGFGVATGNSESASFTGLFNTTHETDSTKFYADAGYFYSQSDGEESDNRFTAGFRNDWRFGKSPVFFFVDGRYDYDEFKSWRHRINGHGGLGYYIVESEEFTFSVLGGIGAVKEFGSTRNEIYPEAIIGADLAWNITERQSLVASSRLYPDLDETGQFRMVNSAGYSIKIDQADGLSFTVGLFHEHESDPDPGLKKNDLKIFGGLTFDF